MTSKARLALALASVAIFALCGAASAAAYEWQLNGAPITTAKATKWTSTLTFENRALEYTLKCTMAHKGSVLGGKSEVTSITSTEGKAAIPCEVTHRSSICEQSAEVEAKGLPWARELALEGDVMRNRGISGSEPRWAIRCVGVGKAAYSDLCDAASNLGAHTLTNGVEETYDSRTPVGHACAEGRFPEFITRGSETPSPSEGTLRIYKAPPEWQLSDAGLISPISVSWSGTIKLTYGPVTAECSDSATGEAGLGGNGQVTTLSVSGCHGKAEAYECEKVATPLIQAVNLPWASELSETGESKFDLMKSGTSTPTLEISCRILGVFKIVDKCTGISGKVTNVTGGVETSWNSDENLVCKREAEESKGKIEGTEKITKEGGTLEVRSYR